MENQPKLSQLYKMSHKCRRQLDILTVQYQQIIKLIDELENKDKRSSTIIKNKKTKKG